MYIQKPTQANFVMPQLCAQLEELLPIETAFYWSSSDGETCELFSKLFDPDNYYLNTSRALNEIKIVKHYPAFSIGELSMILPDFAIDKVNNKYKIFCDAHYGLSDVTSDRIADGLALIVIEGIRKKVLDISSLLNTQN